MAVDSVDACLVFEICMLFLVMTQCINLVRVLCGLNRSSSNRVEGQWVEETIHDEYSVQFPRGNFESSVINSLPVSQFKRDEVEGEHVPVNADCAICLGEFEEGEWLKLLPSCTHGFHVSCIDTWFRSHSNCPLCRRNCVSECSVSLYTLLETLRREDFSTETQFHSVRSEMDQNLEITHESCPHS